jgi:hypothetical protein
MNYKLEQREYFNIDHSKNKFLNRILLVTPTTLQQHGIVASPALDTMMT